MPVFSTGSKNQVEVLFVVLPLDFLSLILI
jgi:hypothetical protein